MTERHTQQGYDMRAHYYVENLGARESYQGWHDYTYGTSKASLRPAVPIDEDEPVKKDTRIPVPAKPKPKPKPKRKPRKKRRRIQPVL